MKFDINCILQSNSINESIGYIKNFIREILKDSLYSEKETSFS